MHTYFCRLCIIFDCRRGKAGNRLFYRLEKVEHTTWRDFLFLFPFLTVLRTHVGAFHTNPEPS